MRLLLDTHIFLWIATNDPRLSTRARRLISAADERFVSSASIWEAAIKAGLGKLDIDVGELIRRNQRKRDSRVTGSRRTWSRGARFASSPSRSFRLIAGRAGAT